MYIKRQSEDSFKERERRKRIVIEYNASNEIIFQDPVVEV